VVFGASSGMGECIAKALAHAGASVVLCARRAEKLQHLASSLGASYQVCDVADRARVAVVFSTLERVDIVVNCAGCMFFQLMKNQRFTEWDAMISANVVGTTNVCGLAVAKMLPQKAGHIVCISSDAAIQTFPALTVYNASKAYTHALLTGIRAECVGTGIRVTEIQPGDVRTELVMTNGDKEAADKVGVSIGTLCGGADPDANSVLAVEDVADAVLFALGAKPSVAVNTILIEPRDQMWGDPTSLAVGQ